MRELLSIFIGTGCLIWDWSRTNVCFPRSMRNSACLASRSEGSTRLYPRSRLTSRSTAPPPSGLQWLDLAPAGSSFPSCSITSSFGLASPTQFEYQVSSAFFVVEFPHLPSRLPAHHLPLASSLGTTLPALRTADIYYYSLGAP